MTGERVCPVAISSCSSPRVVSRVEPVHLGARNHRVLGIALREVEDLIHHQRQLVGKVAALAGVGNDVRELIGGHANVQIVNRLDAQQAQGSRPGLLLRGPLPEQKDGQRRAL